jgi:hypothetical protein
MESLLEPTIIQCNQNYDFFPKPNFNFFYFSVYIGFIFASQQIGTNLYTDGTGYAYNGVVWQNSDTTNVIGYIIPGSCSCCFVTVPYSNAVEILRNSPNSYGYGRVRTPLGVRIGSMRDDGSTTIPFRYFDDNNNVVQMTSGNIDYLICENQASTNYCPSLTTTTEEMTTTTGMDCSLIQIKYSSLLRLIFLTIYRRNNISLWRHMR